MTERKKLKIKCGRVDCENGLHCYRVTKAEAAQILRSQGNTGGKQNGLIADTPTVPLDKKGGPTAGPIRFCKACGVRLVDWERIHRREIGDVDHTFEALRTEWIRHHFWHSTLDNVTIGFAREVGRGELRKRVENRIHTSVGRAPASKLWRDGAQTPLADKPDRQNIIYCAQHATASCCRKCAEEWHNLPRDRALTADEEAYLVELAMKYIDDRLPNLAEGSEPPVADSQLRVTDSPRVADKTKRKVTPERPQ